jgi:hypothetical protein
VSLEPEPVVYCLEGFDPTTEELSQEFDLDPIDHDTIRRLFSLASEEPIDGAYRVDEVALRELYSYMRGRRPDTRLFWVFILRAPD